MASTLEQIAELSGVSRSTVSRVVNRDPRVSDRTRQQVLEIIRTEGYRPNLAARGLATGRANVIAAVIPGGFDSMVTDPFFPNMLQGLAHAADARDYFVMLSLGQPGFNHSVDEIARQGGISGVAFTAGQLHDPLVAPLIESGIPMVSVGRSDDARVSFVDVDNRGSARQVTRHLLRLGRRRIAMIAGPLFAHAACERLVGYKEALESGELPVEDDLIYEGDFSEASGRRAAERLVACRADAIFASSDRMAVGALQAVVAAGLRVPEDIALVGFDDLPIAAAMEPSLTTVRQIPQSLGEAALTLLLDLIEDPGRSPRQQILPTELIVRASCGSLLNQENTLYPRKRKDSNEDSQI